MTSTRLVHAQINLPDVGIPPKTGAVLGKLEKYRSDREAAFQALDDAERILQHARDVEASRRATAYVEGIDAASADPVGDAEAAVAKAQGDADMIRAAEHMLLAELEAAVDADAKTWTTTSRNSSQKALAKLVTALRMAEEARAVLYDGLGILNMFQAREEHGGGLVMRFERGAFFFALDAGLEGIRQGVAEASSELKARKKTTGEFVEKQPEGPEHDEPWDEFGPKARNYLPATIELGEDEDDLDPDLYDVDDEDDE